MKKVLFTLNLFILIACGSDSSLDCFKNAGDIIVQEYTVKPIKKIIVFERVQLIVEQGDVQNIRVETGDNLINEIQVRVEDSILFVSNRNSCNLVRDFGITKLYVTSPNIEEIRNSSSLTVKSSGILKFPRLLLISHDGSIDNPFHNDGGFDVELDVGSIIIDANGVSSTYLRGKAFNAKLVISDSDVRIDAGDLLVQNLEIIHRGTNKMIVNPQQVLRGEIRSLGDVISKNRPPIVRVEELFRGRLIFE